jgi:streptogramin lyase
VVSARAIGSALLALLALALVPASAPAAPAFDGEFAVPGLTETNNKIVEGSDGNMWVTVNSGANDVARITPSGAVQEFALKDGVKEIEAPEGIARGPQGELWVTENEGVAKFLPSNPPAATFTEIVQVKGGASIVAGPDGNMWVATEGTVIKFPPSNPAANQQIPVGGLAPKDIDVAGALLAISDAGGEQRIVTLTTAGVEKDYKLEGASQGLAGTKSGLIGYSEPGAVPEKVGLIAPPTASPGIVLPGGGDPFGVALGSDEAFWVALSAAGKDGVERLTASGQISFLGGLKNESMARQIASGPGNTMWVTITKAGAEGVARISGLEPPPKPPPPSAKPQTKLKRARGIVRTRGRRATVRFRFSSTSAGATFECRLKTLRAKRAKAHASKAVRFRACRSPKTYHLRPGRYRFEVRAVLAGIVDESPAAKSFKVVHVSPKRRR